MTLDAVKLTVNTVTLSSLLPILTPTWSVNASHCQDHPGQWWSSGLYQARVAVRMALMLQRKAAAFNLESEARFQFRAWGRRARNRGVCIPAPSVGLCLRTYNSLCP